MSQNIPQQPENPGTAKNLSAVEEYGAIPVNEIELYKVSQPRPDVGDLQPVDDYFEADHQTAEVGIDTLLEDQDKSDKTQVVRSGATSEVEVPQLKAYDRMNDPDGEILNSDNSELLNCQEIVESVQHFKKKRSSLKLTRKIASVLGVAGDAIKDVVHKFASSTKGEYFVTLFRIWLKPLRDTFKH